jgi:hypothetical protein
LPMDIFGLMQYATDEQKQKLHELITLKATVGEKYFHAKDDRLSNWIKNWLEKAEAGKGKLAVNKNNMVQLNEFFLKMLYATDN